MRWIPTPKVQLRRQEKSFLRRQKIGEEMKREALSGEILYLKVLSTMSFLANVFLFH